MKKMTAGLKSFCDTSEGTSVPYAWYIASFLSIVTVRNLLEDFSDGHFAGGGAPASFYIQTYLFYTVAVIIFSLLLSFAVKRPMRGVSQLVMAGFVILLPTPLIDLIVSKGQGFDMSFLLPGTHDDLLRRFLTFFGSFEEKGITVGQKVQLGMIVLGAAGYVALRGKGVMKTIVVAITSYVIVFLLAASPFVIKFLMSPWNIPFIYTNRVMIQYLFLLGTVTGIVALFRQYPKTMRAFLRDGRPTRLSHCLLLYGLGLVVAWRNGLTEMHTEVMLQIPLTLLAVLAAFLFSIITNNIVDLKIDRVTNALRPLPKRTVERDLYERLSWFVLAFVFLISGTAGTRPMLLVILIVANFFLYSMPPFRLKRIPFLSKIFIAANLLSVTVLGFIAGGGSIITFPIPLALWMLFGFTAYFNVIDIKDYEGDKAEGIPTLPVLLGRHDAKILIALCAFLTYLLLPFALQETGLLPAATILGIVQMALILKKPYRDHHVFIGSGISLALLVTYIALSFPDALVSVGAT